MNPPDPECGAGLPSAPPLVVLPPVAYASEAIAPPVYAGQPGPQSHVGVPVHYAPSNVGQWTTRLFDCLDDLPNCWITCLCPCITFGRNAQMIDRGGTSCVCAGLTCCLICYCFGCSYLYTCTYRTKLRGRYSIPGGECADCCLHCWCKLCAICQEYRELKNRGLDPSIGWAANVERLSRAYRVTVPPSVPGGMMR